MNTTEITFYSRDGLTQTLNAWWDYLRKIHCLPCEPIKDIKGRLQFNLQADAAVITSLLSQESGLGQDLDGNQLVWSDSIGQ